MTEKMLGAKRQDDEIWMKKALRMAKRARDLDEVPVGAVLIDSEGRLLACGYNLRETQKSPLGHAEILCLDRASRKKDSWRLTGTTLYVTLEPCVMCVGALLQARIQRVVFGAYDPKGGALKTLYTLGDDKRLNHQLQILGGVLEAESAQLLKEFFKKKRVKSSSGP